MSTDGRRLDACFNPRRIAVVGASERGMYPAGILQNLLDNGYPGEIYPINPARTTVFGLPCYAELNAAPQRADLAIIVVPRRAVLPALGQCLELGVPAAVIITAGFAEADDEGRRLQADMSRLIKDSSLTVVGPNCAGLANIPGQVIATRLGPKGTPPPRPGPVSFVSQSGALMMAVTGLFADRQIGMNRLLSLGNQVDVTLEEALDYLAADTETGVVGAFAEGVNDGRALVNALRRLLLAGRPLVMIKSGRTPAGQRAAATHTAALAGSDRVFEAVCRQWGVVRVDDVRELLDTIAVMAAFGHRLDGAGRLAIVTQSGGLGSLSADLCELAGLQLPSLSERTQSALRAMPPFAGLHGEGTRLYNPTDVQGAAVIGAATAETLAPFLDDDSTDAVLLLLAKSSVREEDGPTAEAIIAAARCSPKPLLVVWTGQRYPHGDTVWPLAHRMLVEAGIPLFDQPSDCIRALARATRYWRFRSAWLDDPEHIDAGA